jgi:hypothetical protein
LDWSIYLRDPTPVPLSPQATHLLIATDASDTGYGATAQLLKENNGEQYQEMSGFWRGKDLNRRIEVKELLTAITAARTFINYFNVTNANVHLQVDNTVALAYVNRLKSGRKAILHFHTKNLRRLLITRNLTVSASWIASEDNVRPDWLSRLKQDRMDYKLNPKIFKKVCQTFQVTPTIDLFATRENRQCKRFVSRQPALGAFWVNALTLPLQLLSKEVFWANPPWKIIPAVVKMIRELMTFKTSTKHSQLDPSGVLLTPSWAGANWYPLLQQLARKSWTLSAQHSLFANCWGESMPPPGWAIVFWLF